MWAEAREGLGLGGVGVTDAERPAFLAACGHANLDVQIGVQDLPHAGASTPAVERRTVYGGTACNIARHAAGLGVPTRLWARVGGDFPPAWRDGLEADGVDLVHLDVEPDGRTPTCYIFTDAQKRQSYVMDQGAMAHATEHPPGPGFLEGLAVSGGWLHISTGPPEAYMALAQEAQKRGIHVAMDPGQELRFAYGALSFERLLDLSDTLFLNAVELDVALRYLSYGDPVQLLDHVDTLVITHGPDGAMLYQDGKKPHRAAAVQVPAVVDPTGAGDALRAGWYAALRDGQDAGTALHWGQAAAAIKIQHQGPQDHVLRRTELDASLAD